MGKKFQVEKYSQTRVANSVTRWLHYLIKIWLFTKMKKYKILGQNWYRIMPNIKNINSQ